MKDEHVKDAAQGVAEDAPQDAAQDLGFGARAVRALLTTAVFVQLSGIWLGLWANVSADAAQSASMFIKWCSMAALRAPRSENIRTTHTPMEHTSSRQLEKHAELYGCPMNPATVSTRTFCQLSSLLP